MAKPINNIVIVGGGTAGWMAAAALSRTLNTENVSVRLIESDAIGTVGVGEATIPNIATFNAMLGIDEREFMAKTKATIKYGIEFVDWGQKGEAYFHPFGTHGADMDGVSFHQYWMKLRQMNKAPRIEQFCITAMAAQMGKATLPANDPRSVLSRLDYAYQFDATSYAAFLREYAEKRGVTRVEGKVTNVDVNSENGFIENVELETGVSIEGDLFIDCTGFRALLSEKTLGVGYEDWSHWLPCNSAVAVPSESKGPPPPYTRSTAKSAGWQWRIPLQHRTGNGYVYCNEYISDDEAAASLLSSIEAPPLSEVKQLRFKTGYRKEFWVKNCVSLGLSSGFLEPLESTSIYLIQAGITKLLSLFPDTSFNPVEIAEYNRILTLEFEQVRDFLILHYVATKRSGEPFWDYVREMDIPESLQRKIDLFKGRGRFFRYDGELFSETSWVAVFLGQNIMPQGYNPLVDSVGDTDLMNSLNSMQSAILQAVQNMPNHEAFLHKYCPMQS